MLSDMIDDMIADLPGSLVSMVLIGASVYVFGMTLWAVFQ